VLIVASAEAEAEAARVITRGRGCWGHAWLGYLSGEKGHPQGALFPCGAIKAGYKTAGARVLNYLSHHIHSNSTIRRFPCFTQIQISGSPFPFHTTCIKVVRIFNFPISQSLRILNLVVANLDLMKAKLRFK